MRHEQRTRWRSSSTIIVVSVGALGLALGFMVGSRWSARTTPSTAAEARSLDGIRVPAAEGLRRLSPQESETYRIVDDYLAARLAEMAQIRVGSTYAELTEHFRHDGGITGPQEYRLVSTLCPYLKIDVEFEMADWPVRPPPGARIATLSRPYFEAPFTD